VLAVAGFAEVEGTTTNVEGRVTTVAQQVTPWGQSRPDWLIAGDLAARLGHELAIDPAAIWDEVTTVAPLTSVADLDALARPDAVDGVLLSLDPAPGGISFEAPEGVDAPALDSYSLRLVATRTLYDGGTMLAHCPSSAGLAPGPVLRVHPVELERLGLPEGGRVRVTGNDRSFLVDARPDAGVPQGVAAIGWNLSGAPVQNLVEAGAPVAEVRLEVGS
jgi:predicted molibdopterin-dependent oxidoreductase YjgC